MGFRAGGADGYDMGGVFEDELRMVGKKRDDKYVLYTIYYILCESVGKVSKNTIV